MQTFISLYSNINEVLFSLFILLISIKELNIPQFDMIYVYIVIINIFNLTKFCDAFQNKRI